MYRVTQAGMTTICTIYPGLGSCEEYGCCKPTGMSWQLGPRFCRCKSPQHVYRAYCGRESLARNELLRPFPSYSVRTSWQSDLLQPWLQTAR